MNGPATLYYIIGGALLLIFLIAIVIASLKKKKKAKAGDESHYVLALTALIEGDTERAIREFYEAVKRNTDNIDAYIRLGDILREKGEVERAIKIHKELLVRRNLDATAREEVIRSLVKDYVKAGQYDRALQQLNHIFSVEPKNLWAKQMQVSIYEAKGDWENAFKALKTLSKWKKDKDYRSQLALYKVEDAEAKFKAGQEKDGRVRLREALKIDPTCAAAHVALGDSYVREGRHTDAIKVWIDFVRKLPQHAHLVFDRLQEALYFVGNYSEIESLLEGVHKEHPDIPEVAFTLADIRARKGDLDSAIQLCEAMLEKNLQPEQALSKLIKLYSKKGDTAKAMQLAQELADKNLNEKFHYECRVCHFVSSDPLWRCPKCGAWNSFHLIHAD